MSRTERYLSSNDEDMAEPMSPDQRKKFLYFMDKLEEKHRNIALIEYGLLVLQGQHLNEVASIIQSQYPESGHLDARNIHNFDLYNLEASAVDSVLMHVRKVLGSSTDVYKSPCKEMTSAQRCAFGEQHQETEKGSTASAPDINNNQQIPVGNWYDNGLGEVIKIVQVTDHEIDCQDIDVGHTNVQDLNFGTLTDATQALVLQQVTDSPTPFSSDEDMNIFWDTPEISTESKRRDRKRKLCYSSSDDDDRSLNPQPRPPFLQYRDNTMDKVSRASMETVSKARSEISQEKKKVFRKRRSREEITTSSSDDA